MLTNQPYRRSDVNATRVTSFGQRFFELDSCPSDRTGTAKEAAVDKTMSYTLSLSLSGLATTLAVRKPSWLVIFLYQRIVVAPGRGARELVYLMTCTRLPRWHKGGAQSAKEVVRLGPL